MKNEFCNWIQKIIKTCLLAIFLASCFKKSGFSLKFQPNLAILEPPEGAYFGVIPPSESYPNFVLYEIQQLGAAPVIYVTFVTFPLKPGDVAQLCQHFLQVVSVQGIALVTLEPVDGLESVTKEDATLLGLLIQQYERLGLQCMVSFGHEMNGAWYPWGQKPKEYVSAFRIVASEIKNRTNRTALIWSPNEGGGYPFPGEPFTVSKDSPSFSILDTNGDGTISMADDMFSPFYPGDDVVDWVGITIYNWGKALPNAPSNRPPEAFQFYNKLTGNYNGEGGDHRDVPNFYETFCSENNTHKKPLLLAETSQAYDEGNMKSPFSRLQLKQAWWSQVFNTQGLTTTTIDIPTVFPKLKAVVWFDVKKKEAYLDNNTCDWSLTLDPRIPQTFSAYIEKMNQIKKHWLFSEDFNLLLKNVNNSLT